MTNLTTAGHSSLLGSDSDAPGSGLTRLRMGDAIFSSRDDSRHGAGAGFIIIRQGKADPWPRPAGQPGRKAAEGTA